MEAVAEEYGETERLDSYRGIVDEISGKGLRVIDRFSRLLK
jgi:hypothetical protein